MSTVEVLTAVVIMGAATTIGAQFVASSTKVRTDLQIASARETYASFQQDVALQGINPNMVSPVDTVKDSTPRTDAEGQTANYYTAPIDRAVGVTATSSQFDLVPGRSGILAVKANVQNTQKRAGGFGLQVSTSTAGAAGDPTGFSGMLMAPQWPASLTSMYTTGFPYTVDLVYPMNPPGTYYRYTTDGSDPDETSPLWTATTFNSPLDLPATMKARAYNNDPLYLPSLVSTVAPMVGLVSQYARANPGLGSPTSTLFSYQDLEGVNPLTGAPGDTNKILLSEASGIIDGTYYVLRYTLDGSTPTAASEVYPGGAFAPAANHAGWNSQGVVLKVVAFSNHARLRNSDVATYILTPAPVKADDPLFSPLPIAGVRSENDVITVTASGQNTALEGSLAYGGSSEETFTELSSEVAVGTGEVQVTVKPRN